MKRTALNLFANAIQLLFHERFIKQEWRCLGVPGAARSRKARSRGNKRIVSHLIITHGSDRLRSRHSNNRRRSYAELLRKVFGLDSGRCRHWDRRTPMPGRRHADRGNATGDNEMVSCKRRPSCARRRYQRATGWRLLPKRRRWLCVGPKCVTGCSGLPSGRRHVGGRRPMIGTACFSLRRSDWIAVHRCVAGAQKSCDKAARR
jgi:hypothetical protein